MTPKNKDVHKLNKDVLDLIAGETRQYKCIDTIIDDNDRVRIHFPVEILNEQKMKFK